MRYSFSDAHTPEELFSSTDRALTLDRTSARRAVRSVLQREGLGEDPLLCQAATDLYVEGLVATPEEAVEMALLSLDASSVDDGGDDGSGSPAQVAMSAGG